jgi:hypothetical protein
MNNTNVDFFNRIKTVMKKADDIERKKIYEKKGVQTENLINENVVIDEPKYENVGIDEYKVVNSNLPEPIKKAMLNSSIASKHNTYKNDVISENISNEKTSHPKYNNDLVSKEQIKKIVLEIINDEIKNEIVKLYNKKMAEDIVKKTIDTLIKKGKIK